MFPLGKVLVPGEVLPLHVFEPRYRQLVVDLLADDDHPPEFGVVLIERGWEVGGGDARSDVGTVARIVDVQALEGGRYGLVTVGVRRVRVVAWRDDDPYPRADVEDWTDEPARRGPRGSTGRHRPAHPGHLRSRRRRRRGGGGRPNGARRRRTCPTTTPPIPCSATYRLTAVAPIGPADAYRALCAPGPAARLDVLACQPRRRRGGVALPARRRRLNRPGADGPGQPARLARAAGSSISMRPRPSVTRPSSTSCWSTRLAVGRVVPTIEARSSWRSGTTTGRGPWS